MNAHTVATALFSNMNTGGTVRASDGLLDPKGEGYYVGGLVPSLVFDSIQDVDRGELAWWIGMHPFNYYGVWTDSEDGKVYFDAVSHFRTLQASLFVGRQRGEIAIWDIANGKEIRVNPVQ